MNTPRGSAPRSDHGRPPAQTGILSVQPKPGLHPAQKVSAPKSELGDLIPNLVELKASELSKEARALLAEANHIEKQKYSPVGIVAPSNNSQKLSDEILNKKLPPIPVLVRPMLPKLDETGEVIPFDSDEDPDDYGACYDETIEFYHEQIARRGGRISEDSSFAGSYQRLPSIDGIDQQLLSVSGDSSPSVYSIVLATAEQLTRVDHNDLVVIELGEDVIAERNAQVDARKDSSENCENKENVGETLANPFSDDNVIADDGPVTIVPIRSDVQKYKARRGRSPHTIYKPEVHGAQGFGEYISPSQRPDPDHLKVPRRPEHDGRRARRLYDPPPPPPPRRSPYVNPKAFPSAAAAASSSALNDTNLAPDNPESRKVSGVKKFFSKMSRTPKSEK